MMGLNQLERYYKLLQVIQGYEALLLQYENSLKAYNPATVSVTTGANIRRLEDIIIAREKAIEKLPRLKALVESQREEVAETIRAAVPRNAKDGICTALILRMRYLEGRDLGSITTVTGLTEAAVKRRISVCLGRAKERTE